MRFFGIYDKLLPLVVLVVSNRNLCAQVFFLFFSRRLILEKIPIGEWFEDEVWDAVQRFAKPQKGASADPGRPRRTRPGWIDSFSMDRIGEGFSSVYLSRLVLAIKRLSQSSEHVSLSRSHNERCKLHQWSPPKQNSFSMWTLSATSNLLPVRRNWPPMKSVYGQWSPAWSPKLKQPSDETSRNRRKKANWQQIRCPKGPFIVV